MTAPDTTRPPAGPAPKGGGRPDSEAASRILLTGATGYIGGRLLDVLLSRGHRVRCLARRPENLRLPVGAAAETVAGDVLDPASLPPALEGIDTAYYLIHSMAADTWEEDDRRGAIAFAAAARAAGVRRIVYLGGLGEGSALSPHLASRQEVGRILRESGVPAIELRASIVIGSGSLSFEMIRALVERLPIMVTPRWAATETQPIGVEDVIAALVAALDLPGDRSRVLEIGGPERASYLDLMREYARLRGLRRLMLRVPALSPRLSSLWLGLVTPVYARVGRELIEGLRNRTVVTRPEGIHELGIAPAGIRASLERALANEDRAFAATRWSDALSSLGEPHSWAGRTFGTRQVDSRTVTVAARPVEAFAPVERLGGATGWYFGDALWTVRGWLDLLVGGPGMRRGRRDPVHLAVGDTLDCWRVERIERPWLLRLAAEMKLPGRAWLQFEVTPEGQGSSIRQTAIFDPIGTGGRLYWYLLFPLHQVIFSGMLRRLARAADREVPAVERAEHSRRGRSERTRRGGPISAQGGGTGRQGGTV